MFGVADSVMIDNYTDQTAFIDNLRLRFENQNIYTYIRNVCISINPYQDLGIYTGLLIDEYYGMQMYELPPHLYAIANQAYYAMKEETIDQCILISGESGAGKTEAAKQLLQFLAACATDTGRSKEIRDRLLQTNPILEAFGNAKTLRNDNSSRFGKYMEVVFDFKGEPTAGRIINYLLEKSRVVNQLEGERNYHIFYMLLAGASSEWRATHGVEGSPDDYTYTSMSGCTIVPELDDKSEWAGMFEAMSNMDIPDVERDALLAVVSFILLLGNVKFEGSDKASVANPDALAAAERVLGTSGLEAALTVNTIVARGETVKTPLTPSQATYARDALAKSLYDRAFGWLVERLNASLDGVAAPAAQRTTVMGILDIYGFEILSTNGFEQLCINYCNEKLQQLFIELTLKAEQREYEKEGIKWIPVEYFNNQVLCDLVEANDPPGIISLLDDCCLGPGNKTDKDFLAVIDDKFGSSELYTSFASNKALSRTSFEIKHYAGPVTYESDGFIDKNNDLLYRDLKAVLAASTSLVAAKCFEASELDSKKRPATAGTQFRGSMAALMDILMAKTPSYIRCIKPNDKKAPGEWDEAMVIHQAKYLGLMENLRVARAGYCFRRPMESFLERFKSLCPATWPSWAGAPADGCKALIEHLKLPEGEVAIGHTKVFIKNPRTVNDIEQAFQKRKHDLVTKISACFRGFRQRKKYLKLKAAAVRAQMYSRLVISRVQAARRAKAVLVLREFIGGFIKRGQPEDSSNQLFLRFAKTEWLKKVAKSLPRTVIDQRWIDPTLTPPTCADASQQLRRLCIGNLGKRYRATLAPERRFMLTLKLLTSELFRGRKASYPSSVGDPFSSNRIDDVEAFTAAQAAYARERQPNEADPPLYTTILHKIDRSSYKHKRDDMFILSDQAIYVFSYPKVKLKFRLPLDALRGITCSTLFDGFVLIQTPGEDKGDKGDMLFDTPHVYELVTYVMHQINQIAKSKPDFQRPEFAIQEQISHVMKAGKVGTVIFAAEPAEYRIVKVDGKKQLQICAPVMETTKAFQKATRASMRLRAPAAP